MKPADLKALRITLGLTQAEMAERIGLGSRAYQALEAGEAAIRPIHINAAERAALAIAVERRQPMLAPANIRSEALDLVALLRGESSHLDELARIMRGEPSNLDELTRRARGKSSDLDELARRLRGEPSNLDELARRLRGE